MRFCSETIVRMAVLASMISCGLMAESAAPAAPAGPQETPRVVSVVRTDVRTGRLVRVIVSSNPGAKQTVNPAMLAAIDETARNLKVSPELVHSVIQVESNYNTYAVSP